LKLGPAAHVSAKPRLSRGEDGILNQNPIFEITSGVKLKMALQVVLAIAENIGLILAVFQVISQISEA